MKPLIQGHSVTAPETSRNAFSMSQGSNEDESQSDSHPEAGIFHNKTTQSSVIEDRHDMMTGVHQDVTYCSPNTSSGKQKKNPSTSRPQFRSENTPATIETHQILLAHQRLATRTIRQVSITLLTEFPSCQSCSPQRCPPLTGNLKSSSCLMIFSKGASSPYILTD